MEREKERGGSSNIMNWHAPLNIHKIKKYYPKEVWGHRGGRKGGENQGGAGTRWIKIMLLQMRKHVTIVGHTESWRKVTSGTRNQGPPELPKWVLCPLRKRNSYWAETLTSLSLFLAIFKMWVIKSIWDTLLQSVTCCVHTSPLWVGMRLKGRIQAKYHLHWA